MYSWPVVDTGETERDDTPVQSRCYCGSFWPERIDSIPECHTLIVRNLSTEGSTCTHFYKNIDPLLGFRLFVCSTVLSPNGGLPEAYVTEEPVEK